MRNSKKVVVRAGIRKGGREEVSCTHNDNLHIQKHPICQTGPPHKNWQMCMLYHNVHERFNAKKLT